MQLTYMTRYSLAVIAAAGLCMASCSDDAAPVAGGDGAVVLKAQRQGGSTWAAGSRVAVLADGKTYTYTLGADGTMTPEGSPLTWGGSGFGIKAWTPVTDGEVSLTDQTEAAKLAACDFLAAATTVTSRYTYLIFSHQMTRMIWNLRRVDSSYTDEQVRDARICFLGYGAADFSTGSLTVAGNPDSEIRGYETTAAGVRSGEAMMAPADMWGKPLVKVVIGGDEYIYTPDRADAADLASGAGDLVAGQTQTYNLSISRKALTVQVETTDVAWDGDREFGSDDIADAKLTADIAGDVSDKPGYTVTGLSGGYIQDRATGFSITYTEEGLGGLTWTGSCTVTRTETAVEGSATASTQTYTFTDIKTDISVSYLTGVEQGDYLYDNGTWGKEETREGCKTVGRVFHAGRDSRDDSTYPLCKVRGYVVPLQFGNTAELKWFVNQSETKYLEALANIPVIADAAERESYCGGYLLTGLLDTDLAPFSADWEAQIPFWYAFKTIDMASPALSSGWYIPTYAQLKDVCASGMYERFQGTYWSSQVYPGTGNAGVWGIEEGDKTTLWAIRCGADQAVGYGWAIDPAKLLPILTF